MQRIEALLNRLRTAVFFYRYAVKLPPSVRRFYFQARRIATTSGDADALLSFTHPFQVLEILRLAEGRREVVEIGTSTGWTAVALALADTTRHVASYDPVAHVTRDRYLALAPTAAARIDLIQALGEHPATPGPVDFLFIDGAHDAESTTAAFLAWQPLLAPGATVLFHDYDWPGVREALDGLGLDGATTMGMYAWTAPVGSGGDLDAGE